MKTSVTDYTITRDIHI